MPTHKATIAMTKWLLFIAQDDIRHGILQIDQCIDADARPLFVFT